MYVEQKIIRALDRAIIEQLANEQGDNKGLTTKLPAMLRRSGLIQVVLWLQGSDSDPKRWLHQQLRQGVGAVISGARIDVNHLAKLSGPAYLAYQRIAVDVAVMISRLVDAHKPIEMIDD